MKKMLSGLVVAVLVWCMSSVAGAQNVPDGAAQAKGASARAQERASDQAIFHRVSDWFATVGKSEEEKETILTERKAKRAQEKAQKMAEKAKRAAQEKAEEARKEAGRAQKEAGGTQTRTQERARQQQRTQPMNVSPGRAGANK